MKTIEEKAKAYDEALEKLRSLHDDYDTVSTLIDIKEELENIFPELRESEDERIRKRIIALVNAHGQGMYKDEMLAWLEKQGEQNPVEKSDVYPPTLNEAIDLYYYSYGNGKGGFDKLSLEKFRDIVKTFVEDYSKQNPAWSEEDAKICGKCIDAASGYYSPEDKQIMKDWLRNLKERVLPQQKKEWSEEDEVVRNDIIEKLSLLKSRAVDGGLEKEICAEEITWLKYRLPQKLSNVERNGKNWKPSDKQITALRWVLNHIPYNSHKEEISGMLEQLKKL